MKITFVIQDLFQQGAQYVTSLMASGFAAKGYEVDVLVSKVHENLLKQNDIKPFPLPDGAKLIILDDCRARNNIGAIRRYLRSGNSDVIVAMDPNYTTAVALASIGLLKKPKLAYVEHSSLAGFDRDTLKPLAPQWYNLHWLMRRFIVSRFDSIMAVSKGTANAVERNMALKKGSVQVVYNPVVDENYINKVRNDAKHPWLTNKSCPIVIAAGAHCGFKNHLMLFEAIKEANKHTKVRLILFGKGALTQEYRAWIEQNGMGDLIDLPGHTDNLPAEIKEADAFIVSSNLESFSIVLIEALAAGTPVISTDCPFGPPELLAGGKYGTLVPVGDYKKMAEAIVALVSEPKQIPPVEAWERFKIDNVVDSYVKALNV